MNAGHDQLKAQRAPAYGRVVKTLDDLPASKLHPAEQQTVREAVDALFFCEDRLLATQPPHVYKSTRGFAPRWRRSWPPRMPGR